VPGRQGPTLSRPRVNIAGAGPAGLTAAIVLARRGHAVRVYERSHQVGRRFNDDFQGLENWSTRGDCLDELRAHGIEPTWWSVPFSQSELRLSALRAAVVRSPRPLFYALRRGAAHPGSLDNALLRQARAAGVEVCLGQRAEPSAVQIFAGGPSGRPVALARGLSFALDRPEFSATILCDHLAPRGYIYFLVAEGQATLGTVQVGDLRGSTQRLQAAVDAVERRWEFRVPATAAAWAGHAGFAIPRHCMRGRTLVVGEAAGFQDALFGFGIRTAMLSGALAAISLSGGQDYESAWRSRLLPYMRASRLNRAVYERAGAAKSLLWHLLKSSPDARPVLRRLYAHSPIHQMLSPFVRAGLGA